MAGDLNKFHVALDDIDSVAALLEEKACAYEDLCQSHLAAQFFEASKMLRNARKEIGGAMSEELLSHIKSQQIGQTNILTTLIHLSDKNKENQISE